MFRRRRFIFSGKPITPLLTPAIRIQSCYPFFFRSYDYNFAQRFVDDEFLASLQISIYFNNFFSTSTENKPVINPTVYNFLLNKHHFSPEAATEAASVITRFTSPEKSNSLLSFLKKNDFSDSHLVKILKYNPLFISADLEKSVKPKIKILQQLGIPNHGVADLCSTNASIFYRSVDNRLIPALLVLRGLLGSDSNVAKLVMKSGWFLSKDLDKSMVPNIEFLKSRSVLMEQIIRIMHFYPRFLLQKPENFRRYANKAEKFGASPSSRQYIYAVRVVASMSDEAWERKLEAFRDLGFSEGDILNTFTKYPPVFAVSVRKIREVSDILISTGRYDVESIVRYPISLASSVEKRFKPRLQVLTALERKKLIEKWPGLPTICGRNDMNFYMKFVAPYIDEVGHLFVLKGSSSSQSMPVS